jgi:Porin PorA
MRRVIGLTLAGLGAFLVVAAVLTRTYVGGQLIKFPLNEYVKTTLLAKNVSYFSPALVKNVTGATIRVTDTVKGDAKAGTSSTTVWDEFTYLYDVTNGKEYAVSTRRAAFDRRTAQLVNCCGASVNGNSTIRQTGVSGYVFPIGTQKQTYDVFDTSLNRPVPFHYAGTGTIDGITVYRFVERVPPTQTGSQKLPGALVGLKQSMVTLPMYYAATNTYWVDPQTGGVLDTTQDQKQTLQDANGTQRLLLFDGNIVMTPQSVQQAVSLDATGRNELHWFQDIGPLIAGVVGVVLLIAGIVLVWLKRRDQPEQAEAEEPESALGPAL